MTIETLETVFYKLEKLLYGHNYEVNMGLDIFNNCTNLGEFKICLKNKYPNSKPESISPVPLTIDDLWEKIDFNLNYRGDDVAGVELNETQQAQFLELKDKYKYFIRENTDLETRIYSYPDETGIPGYPVWWDYRFILINRKGRALFLYGSASD